MMQFEVSKARNFIKSVDLSGTPRGILSKDAATEAGEVFDQAKEQAQVIGSGVFSFAEGVDVTVREAISDSALLAQLVANKKADFSKNPLEWFKEYANVLENVGWTLQEGGWTDYPAAGTNVEVNEQILTVMTAILGPAPAALTIIKATVDALKAMTPGSSWFTIFSRESEKANIARFQIGLVNKDAAGDVFVSLLACLIEARNTITQVLFFKFSQANARFSANSSKVSINRAALAELGPDIRTIIRAYQADYLSSIKDLMEHPADEGGNTGLVTTAPDDPLNLRASPGTQGQIVTTLPTGTQVTILGESNVGGSRWLNVTANGHTGWVAARFVDLS